jgi:signal transduction histidine kinase
MRGAEYSNGAWHYGTRIRRKDDSEFDAQITVTWVPGSGAASIGEVLLFRDVGQEKALQAQKDRFIASASHELRTPVTNLKMRLYLARHQPDKVDDHLSAIENSTNHMMNLVENLLDVSRFERGLIVLHHERVTLQELVEQVVEDQRLVAQERRVSLESNMPPAPIPAFVDPDRILQVIANLVTNAINYTPANGRVLVKLAREGRNGREQAVIAVRDTGIGIPPEAVAHIFEPFYRGTGQASVKGTGLGLTIVREIVTLHGGEVAVQSEIGVGSTFFVRLPLNS